MKEKLKKYLTIFKLCCFIYVSNKKKCIMSLYAVYIDLKLNSWMFGPISPKEKNLEAAQRLGATRDELWSSWKCVDVFQQLIQSVKSFQVLAQVSWVIFLCLWSDNFHSHTYINTRPLNCFLGKETMWLVLNLLKKSSRIYFHFLSMVVLSSVIWSRTNMPGINEVFRFAVVPLVNRPNPNIPI